MNDYQKQAARTLTSNARALTEFETMVLWNAIGISGESGEVADLVKKGIFHEQGLNIEALKKEIGDVLWYLAALCTVLDLDLNEVMETNIEKLKTRYPDGWDASRSTFREGLAK